MATIVDKALLDAVKPRVGGAKGVKQTGIIAALAGTIQDVLARYQINTPLRIAHFLAQVAHESDGFCTCEEYASGAAYEGRKDLGNTQPGDGKRYKGRGLIQLTGRANYKTYGGRIGEDLVGNPVRAADPPTSLILACEYWKNTRGGLNQFADKDDIVTITRAINGGLNGLDDRKQYLAKAKKILAGAPGAVGAGVGGAASQPAGQSRPVLRVGANGPPVEQLQRMLCAAGFPLAVDGAFGPGTEIVVKAFQKARGLPDDGIVGPASWGALDAAATPPTPPRPMLRLGARGDQVEALQRLLVKAGDALAVDGDFGLGTDAAVRRFQRASALGDDGVVGPATWTALEGGG
jgi:putative chitinase